MKKLLLPFALLLLFISGTRSQDLHFSLAGSLPVTVNPAQTGNYSGDFMIQNVYRTQWFYIVKPFVTSGIAYDHRFYFRHDIFSANLVLINDRSGVSGLSSNSLFLSGSYQKNINGHNAILGFQAGRIMKHFNGADLTFPNQFDNESGYFNSQLSNHENFNNLSVSYWDLNVGMIWNKKINKWNPQAGFAIHHLNRPETGYFLTGAENEKSLGETKSGTMESFHIDIRYTLNDKIKLHPQMQTMIRKHAHEILYGLKIDYSFTDGDFPRSVSTGIFMRSGIKRNTDAAILILGFRMNKTRLELAYDINVSEFNVATKYQGAFEIVFTYTGLETRFNRQNDSGTSRF